MGYASRFNKRQGRPLCTGYHLVFGYLGAFMIMIGVLMLVPLIMLCFFPREGACWPSFLAPAGAAMLIGYILYFINMFRAERGQLSKHHDHLLLVLLWFFAILYCALPFCLNHLFVSGAHHYTFSEAVFESTSGLSATGLPVWTSYLDAGVVKTDSGYVLMQVTEMEKNGVDVAAYFSRECPHIFLFYRTWLQFLGGVGLVLIAASLISDANGLKLYTAEGHSDKLVSNFKRTARLIFLIYAGYIALGTLVLWLFGMDWFDALNHSIPSLATGGFSVRSTSLYYYLGSASDVQNVIESYASLNYLSPLSHLSGFNGIMPVNTIGIEVTDCVLMMLGATSFALHFALFTGKFRKLLKDTELRFFFLLFGISLLFVSLGVYSQWNNGVYTEEELSAYHLPTKPSVGQAVRYAAFQLISCISTTGFSSVPSINVLGPAALFISIVCMSIGAGMGSTGGGMKQYRVVELLKECHWGIHNHMSSSRLLTPHSLYRLGERKQISDSEFKDTSVFLGIYLFTIVLGATILSLLPGTAFDEAIYESASALSGTGNSMIDFHLDPVESYAVKNPLWAYNTMLWTLTIEMFIGRLEIMPVFYGMLSFRDYRLTKRQALRDIAQNDRA